MNWFLKFSISLALYLIGVQFAQAAPLTFMYEGRLSNNGAGIETGAGTFVLNVKIKSPATNGGCTLWEETHNVSTPVGSSGRFRVEVGTGTYLSGVGAANFADVFDNAKTINGLSTACDSGGTTYNPANLDKRSLISSVVYNSNTYTFAALEVSSSPFSQSANFANVAKSVGVDGVTSAVGKYFGYMPNGTACAANQVLKWNGSVWDCAADATGGAPGDASYAAKGIVQFDTNVATSGINITAGVARLANSGVTSGVYGSATQVPAITVDAFGRLTAVTATTIAIPASAIASGTLNISQGGTGTSSLAANRMVMVNGTGTALTNESCTVNQVLQFNGTNWACVNAPGLNSDGTVTNVTSANSDITVATGATTPVLTLNSGLGSMQIPRMAGTGQFALNYGSAAAPMYSFSGDFGTGMWRSGANELSFSTNGVNRMTLNSAGNLGLGTTTPSQRLEVGATTDPANSLHVNTSNTGIGKMLINVSGWATFGLVANKTGATQGGVADGTLAIASGNPGSMVFVLNNTERVRINDSNGNVGIGTTAIPAQLTVKSSSVGITTIRADAIASQTSPLLDLKDSALTSRFVVTAAGNVGVGTTTPTANLEVNGTLRVGLPSNPAILGMGGCTTTSLVVNTGGVAAACTGIPGAGSISVSCSPPNTATSVSGITAAANGANSIKIYGAATTPTSLIYNCSWIAF